MLCYFLIHQFEDSSSSDPPVPSEASTSFNTTSSLPGHNFLGSGVDPASSSSSAQPDSRKSTALQNELEKLNSSLQDRIARIQIVLSALQDSPGTEREMYTQVLKVYDDLLKDVRESHEAVRAMRPKEQDEQESPLHSHRGRKKRKRARKQASTQSIPYAQPTNFATVPLSFMPTIAAATPIFPLGSPSTYPLGFSMAAPCFYMARGGPPV